MPILRNAAAAVIEPEKLLACCLDPQHPDGRHKARVFASALGFNRSNHADLLLAIRSAILITEAESLGEMPHGYRWRVDLPLTGPGGTAMVRTGWIYEKGQDVPRLTTAFVLPGGRPATASPLPGS